MPNISDKTKTAEIRAVTQVLTTPALAPQTTLAATQAQRSTQSLQDQNQLQRPLNLSLPLAPVPVVPRFNQPPQSPPRNLNPMM